MNFKNLCKGNKVVIFDGAMGTMLQEENLPKGVCPESYNLSHPEVIKKIHQGYVDAGAQVIETNTFGANSLKLKNYKLENKTEEIIVAGVKLARKVAKKKKVLVAGSIGPLGELVEPLGKVTFDEAVDVFDQQASLLKKAGCDCLIIETISDLQEIRAAIIACKETKLPVIATMTFQDGLRTVTGTDTATIVMQSLGVDVIGANCSSGPKELFKVARQMVSVAIVPVLIQPNAGLPKLENGKTVFPLAADEFAGYTRDFIKLGVQCLGGCCGTTPEHIKQLVAHSSKLVAKSKKKEIKTYLTSRTKTVEVGNYPVIIGERINPTARKSLAEAIKTKNYSLILQEAKAQIEAGCDLLDVNVSVPGTDEKESIKRIVLDLSTTTDRPLVIDSPNYQVIEGGLKYYPGKVLVNSVTGEKEKLKKILPLVKKYGAALIGLCIDEKGIPKNWQKRVKITCKIVKETDKIGIPRKDVFIDCLTLAISAEPYGINETLKAIGVIKEKYKVKTVLGVSNVSYGLPNRSLINATFLAMAISAGLDAVIMNPLDEKMKETLLAAAYLAGRDANGQRYLAKFSGQTVTGTPPATGMSSTKALADKSAGMETSLKQSIIIGDKDGILELTEQLLPDKKPMDIINQEVIPALEEVGKKYEQKEYFLPQLMLSAECAQVAMKHLHKQLEPGKTQPLEKQTTIVFATVKGDVHDIGKNIVITILQNYGHKIIDLGKDVSAEKIVEVTKKNKADIVALSALMTTTIGEMKIVIDLLKQKNVEVKVIIGGAVVTQEYADSIGASAYGKDAVEAARVIKQLVTK